jgi:hypothetical protein
VSIGFTRSANFSITQLFETSANLTSGSDLFIGVGIGAALLLILALALGVRLYRSRCLLSNYYYSDDPTELKADSLNLTPLAAWTEAFTAVMTGGEPPLYETAALPAELWE